MGVTTEKEQLESNELLETIENYYEEDKTTEAAEIVEIAILEPNDTPRKIENCIEDHVNKAEAISEAVVVINAPQIVEEITETQINCDTASSNEDIPTNEATETNKIIF